MGSFNKVILLGNLTRDPEVRHTSTDMAVANFGLAVNRRFRTKDGTDREETTFVDCEAWARQAEVIGQYFSKGKPIFVEGRLKLDQWTDKDGQNRSKLRVVVENFQFVESRGGGGGGGDAGGGGNQGRHQEPVAAGSGAGGRGGDPIPEEDIPF